MILTSTPPPVFFPEALKRKLVLQVESTRGDVVKMGPDGKQGAEADVVVRLTSTRGTIEVEGLTPAGKDFVLSFMN